MSPPFRSPVSGGAAEGAAHAVEAPAPAPPPPLEWRVSEVFTERAGRDEASDSAFHFLSVAQPKNNNLLNFDYSLLVHQVDVISAIEFDSSGSYLATGYRGGQIVLSERTDIKNHVSRRDLERADYSASRHAKYSYKTQFQSHKSEFDSLRSLEISEKINKIRWCQPANSALYLLSTNDKTIKFWKVQEKKVKIISEMNSDTLYSSGNCSVASSSTASPPVYLPNGGRLERQYNYISNDLSFPPEGFPSLRFTTVASQQKSLIAQCRRVYANSHDYNIHSISNNSDGETFISADDLRINLWNLEMCNQGFNIVDAKPANMEHLSGTCFSSVSAR
ncbi:Serine/threonine protein phosphatase 2A 55 kDa regulatory subunit B beta isoform, partial [Ananas comosus]